MSAVVPGAAVALRLQVAESRQEFRPGVGGVLDEMRWHLIVEQGRDVPRPFDGHVQEAAPLLCGQFLQQDVGTVRRAVAALDDGCEATRAHRHGAHGARARACGRS